MNKLDYPENLGKIFLRNLEIIHLTEGLDEAFSGLLSSYSDPEQKLEGVKLKGCEVTVNGSNYDVTAGYVYLAGEVFKVNSQSIVAGAGETVYFDIEQTDYDPNWPAPIEGGTSHQTRKKRIAKLVKSSTPPNDRMGVSAPTLTKKIMDETNPPGKLTFLDPRLEGKAMADYFNMSTGEGLVGKLYEGWIVLGIYTGTEDYIKRAIVNIDKSDTDLDTVGKVYGSKTHQLTEAEMPAHSHRNKRSNSTTGAGNYFDQTSSGSDSVGPVDGTVEETGGNQAHNNMQPSIVAAFITRKSDNGYYV